MSQQSLGAQGRHVRVVLDVDVLFELNACHLGAGLQHLDVPGVLGVVEARVPPVRVRIIHRFVERRHPRAIVQGAGTEIDQLRT